MIISVKEVKKYIYCVLIPLLVGFLSSILSKTICGIDMSTYYHELIKPGFAPPGIIFPIVWTILYIYWLQLGLNFLWSILFFGFQLRLTALIDLVLLFVFLVIMVYKFYKVKPIAAYLNIAYILWTIYAFILNYFIWLINK